MTIVKAVHIENDSVRKVEHFSSMDIAKRYTDRWRVTDWGWITFQEIQVIDA